MQTRNLCEAELGALGRVVPSPDWQHSPRRMRLALRRDAPTRRFRARSTLTVDYADGMTLLVLDPKGLRSVFYLDRAVELAPGTEFCVLPFFSESSVRITAEEADALEPLEQEAESFSAESITLGLGSIYTFFRQEGRQDFYFRGERHAPCELTIVTRGALHTVIDGENVRTAAGQYVLIGQNAWHMQYSESPVRFLTLSFAPGGASCLAAAANRALTMNPFQEQLAQLMDAEDGAAFSADYLASLLNLFLIELLRHTEPPARAEKKRASTRYQENQIMNEALQIISARCRERLSLAELAGQLHVSVPYLHALFRTQLGIPPGKYMAHIRLEECKALLRSGTLSVSEVAQQMGFSSVQQFSRRFHEVCGVPPSQFSKEHDAQSRH